jgi:hypothetical protein
MYENGVFSGTSVNTVALLSPETVGLLPVATTMLPCL